MKFSSLMLNEFFIYLHGKQILEKRSENTALAIGVSTLHRISFDEEVIPLNALLLESFTQSFIIKDGKIIRANLESVDTIPFPDEKMLKFVSEAELESTSKQVLREMAMNSVIRKRILEVFSKAVLLVEKKGDDVFYFVVNANIYSSLSKYCTDVFELIYERDKLDKGLFGHLWGKPVYVQESAKGVQSFSNKEELKKCFPNISVFEK